MMRKTIKDLIFEMYHDRNDTILHSIYLKYDIKKFLKLLNYEKNISTYI